MTAVQSIRPKYRQIWLTAGWLQLGIIMYLAMVPLPAIATTEIYSDKVVHFLAFMALMVWFCGVYPPRNYWRIFLMLLAYGVAMEIGQSMVPNRFAEFADLLADAAGAALGWLLAIAGLARWPLWLERLLPGR